MDNISQEKKEEKMVKKADEVLKDLCFMVVVILAMTFAGYCFAQDFLSQNTLTDVEVTVERDIDNIVILPATKTIVIRIIERYLDAEGEVVRTKAGNVINFIDREDDENTLEIDESCTDYTDFLINLGITKAKLRQAIKEVNQ